MQKPTLGWQSWSPPYPSWHGYPLWDYSPFSSQYKQVDLKSRRPLKQSLVYWCSWYAHSTNINDDLIAKNVAVIKTKRLPINTILIDDGWTPWGDWSTPNPQKFPNLAKTIRNIHKQKLLVGLWLAPFLADKSSVVYNNHPEWFVTHKNKHVQGFKTFPLFEPLVPHRPILNASLPEVKKYLTDCIDRAVKEWSVDVLKLDFLYAPYFDPNHVSEQVANAHIVWLLNYIHKHYPHVITIGCGAPFHPAAKITDVMRIYRDTAFPPYVPKWLNKIVYHKRVKNLGVTMGADIPEGLNTDPDVRMFSLDSPKTERVWDTIHPSILGVGDDLTKLSTKQLLTMNLWLKNHSSRSSSPL